jgi:hypothetical protein
LRAKPKDTARIHRVGAEAEEQNAKRENGKRVLPDVTPKKELPVEAKKVGIILVSGKNKNSVTPNRDVSPQKVRRR